MVLSLESLWSSSTQENYQPSWFFEVKLQLTEVSYKKRLNTLLFGMFNAGEMKLTPQLIH